VTSHKERKILPYTAEEMFALVGDIERYPEFLPWCRRLKIRERREEAGQTVLVADMTISFKVVSESFTSKVVLEPATRRIDVTYVNGPFRYLHNRWQFEPQPQGSSAEGGCTVDFFIDFEFKSRALGMLIGAVFHVAIEKLVAAFEARARALYRPSYPPAAAARPV
jgi:coenzyme Q-binding protein COQ10